MEGWAADLDRGAARPAAGLPPVPRRGTAPVALDRIGGHGRGDGDSGGGEVPAVSESRECRSGGDSSIHDDGVKAFRR